MKKLLIFTLMIASLFMTACESSDDTTTTTVTTTTSAISKDTPPYYWVCNGISHEESGKTKDTVLYSGPLGEFDDEGVFNGYELKGELHKETGGFKKEELETFGYKDGMEVHYNSEKDSYLLCYKMGIHISELYEHTCNEDCKKVTE